MMIRNGIQNRQGRVVGLSRSAALGATPRIRRSTAPRAAHDPQRPCGAGVPDEAQPVMVNENTLWLQAAGSARPVLFGESWLLFPPGDSTASSSVPPSRTAKQHRSTGGPPASAGLVPWRGGAAAGADLAGAGLVVVPAGPRGIIPLTGEPVVLTGSGYIEAEVVDAEVLPPDEGPSRVTSQPLLPPPAPTALVRAPPTGLVPAAPAETGSGASAGYGLVPSSDAAASSPEDGAQDTEDGVYESFSNSPRRLHKIKFTCRRCGATSIRPLNIHAWQQGSVFARCGKCRVTHKLIDNLKLFHEMSGPVFDPPGPPLDPATPLPPELQLRLEQLGVMPASGNAPGAGPVVGGYERLRDAPRSDSGPHADDKA